MRLRLNTKLTLAIVLTGLIPMLVISWLAANTTSRMAADIGASYRGIARNLSDKIDRNLFERYGDVQAFGANEAVNDRTSWYQTSSISNKIAAAANRYANLYGFYSLSYLVDTEGRVVAVNDRDPSGKPIDSAWLYQKSFKDAEWFRETMASRFLKSDVLDGTYVQDLHADEDVRKIYAGDGLVLGFSAPVKNASGQIVGVWHNCANFSLVEEIITSGFADLKQGGLTQSQLTVIDRTGRVLLDFDPASAGGKETVSHDPNVLLKLNLAQQGMEAARELLAGKSGFVRAIDERTKVAQMTGYAICDGELGFPGLKWGVMVRVPESQALVAMKKQTRNIIATVLLSLAALVTVGLVLASSISRPLAQGIESLRLVGAQLTESSSQFTTSSVAVAEGASEQAASLEETSATLEEMSSMTRRNAESATNGSNLGRQAKLSAGAGLGQINEMGQSLITVKSAVSEMESAVTEMKNSSQEISKIIKTIDEIAFQTNILALNAAVEAARAGESGAGFAVVADEVRALAQRSAQAAKDTSEKIEAAIKRSELGGVASAKVVQSLGEIEQNATDIGQAFQGIVGQVTALDEVISQIASASHEQSQGTSEVNIAVTQMETVTMTNAASAEENAAASQELAQQAIALKGIVGQLESLISGQPLIAGVQAVTKSSASKSPKRSGQPKAMAKTSAAQGASSPTTIRHSDSATHEAGKRGSFQNF